MISNDKMICKEFETEVYLYIDNDLSAERLNFWRGHLTKCNDCASLLKEVEMISNVAEEKLTEDLLDVKYDKMIERAVRQKKFSIGEWFFPKEKSKEKFALATKIAIVSGLAVIAVIISLLSPKPNPVKAIPNDLLDWEGKKIVAQINEVKTKLKLIHGDNWDKQIIMIDQRMKDLEKESDKFSFN